MVIAADPSGRNLGFLDRIYLPDLKLIPNIDTIAFKLYISSVVWKVPNIMIWKRSHSLRFTSQ
jgi:hypothetical protein